MSPAQGHGPFAVWNRTVNPVVKGLLRSPLHRLIDSRLALITVIGMRSRRGYTFPVGYEQVGDHMTVSVGWPERKLWWRNLAGGGKVRMRIRGVERTGHARAHSDEHSAVTVEITLDPIAMGSSPPPVPH